VQVEKKQYPKQSRAWEVGKTGLGMTELRMILVAVLMAWMAMQAVGQGVPDWAKGCIRYWKQYEAKPGHKAFAIKRSVTADPFYCGFSWSAATVEQAKAVALKSCAQKACYIIDSK
jgi:hypothetical protein